MIAVLASKKFVTGLFASMINLIAVALGLPLEAALAISSPLTLGLAYQGVVDVRKAGPTAGSVAAIVLAVAVLGGGAVGLAGCGAAQRASASFLDCMQPRTKALASELTGLVADTIRHAADNNGRVDWATVREVVAPFKSAAPRCAFRAAVIEALRPSSGLSSPQAAGLEYSPDELREGYAAINAEVFGASLEPLP